MNRLRRVTFEFEDNTEVVIDDPRAALLFQSRCNSNGIFSGMEDSLIEVDKAGDKEQPKDDSCKCENC